jgi:hypothetical protein
VIVAFQTNAVLNEEIIPLGNTVSGEENFLITATSFERSKKLNACMGYWKNSFENVFGRQSESRGSPERIF